MYTGPDTRRGCTSPMAIVPISSSVRRSQQRRRVCSDTQSESIPSLSISKAFSSGIGGSASAPCSPPPRGRGLKEVARAGLGTIPVCSTQYISLALVRGNFGECHRPDANPGGASCPSAYALCRARLPVGSARCTRTPERTRPTDRCDSCVSGCPVLRAVHYICAL